MSLKEQLMNDLKLAMKEKDTVKKNTVQMVRAAVLQVEKDNKTELDDQSVLDIIAKEVKKRKDSIADFDKGGRPDLVDNANAEIAVLNKYLPEQLSVEELAEIIKASIAETGATSMKDIGRVMGNVLPKVKGAADGRTVNEIAKGLLS